MSEYKIPFTVWGFDSSFGIFVPKSKMNYPNDLNMEVLRALGMNVPEGTGALSEPEKISFPFVIYDDFAAKKIHISSYGMKEQNSYCTEQKREGNACIMIKDVERYGALRFSLANISLDELNSAKNAYLCFDVKFTNKNQSFQVRFVDTDDGDGKKLPYRLIYDVNASDYKAGEWNKVEIPVSQMNDVGAWSNILSKWFNSNGDFDFHRINTLEFVAENGDIKGIFYLDDIKILLK